MKRAWHVLLGGRDEGAPGAITERWVGRWLTCVAVVVGALLWGPVQEAEAQDSVAVKREGRALHRPTKTLFLYRIFADSTVYIREGRPGSDPSSITLPEDLFTEIYDRMETEFSSPNEDEDYVAVGYEDQYLVLQFTQRVNLYMLVTLIAVVVVGGALLTGLWWRLSKERRRRRALARSRRFLTQGREKERERLAREIHDGPVQDLHGLHMQLKGRPDDGLQSLEEELMRVTGELRAMSADLHPPALRRFGLSAALRAHADRLQERHSDVEVSLDGPEDPAEMPDAYALSVFRIAQEAMNNAVQHGAADHIQIQLQRRGDTIELEVVDDGVGFSPPDEWHALADRDHYGVLGMQERADAIGAVLTIDSAPGDGTRVHLRGVIDAEQNKAEHASPTGSGA